MARNTAPKLKADAMTDKTRVLGLSRLPRDRETPFEIKPEADARQDLAAEMELIGVRKLRFAGTLSPEGKRDWRLDGALGATVVQSCVVTLEPVTTRIDTQVTRRYLADFEEPDPAEEVEMPEDDTAEPLPTAIDLWQVMTEALTLSLPAYPRADGADLGEAVFAAPGVAPMRDEDTKPLAGLAALKARMEDGSDPES